MTSSADLNPPPALPERGWSAEPRRLLRSRTNRVLSGVCGGIAESYGADPTAVRLLTVLIALFTAIFPMLIVYLIAAIVIPERVDGAAPYPASGASPVTVSPGQGGLVVGVLLIGVGVVALANQLFRVDWDLLWPAVLVVLGAVLVIAAGRR